MDKIGLTLICLRFLSCVSKTEAGGWGMGVDSLLRREHMGSLAKGFPWVLSAKKEGKSREVLSMRCFMTVHRYRSRFINPWHYWRSHLVLDDSLLWGHPVHCRRLSSIPGLCSLTPVTTWRSLQMLPNIPEGAKLPIPPSLNLLELLVWRNNETYSQVWAWIGLPSRDLGHVGGSGQHAVLLTSWALLLPDCLLNIQKLNQKELKPQIPWRKSTQNLTQGKYEIKHQILILNSHGSQDRMGNLKAL